MLTRSLTTTLLQIFFELLLYSQVISESMKVADNIFQRNSEYEWVKDNFGTKQEFEIYLKESCW